MQPSEEIKQKLDIVDLLKEYIQLIPSGMNFKARCPFHNEKTPSLMVSQEKQIWRCFGCGEGGDHFTFVQKIEGVDFIEALRILAPKAGVQLKRQDPRVASERNKLLDIMEISRRYYHQLLIKDAKGKSALKYLTDRGLSKDTIEEWQIGYSLDSWDAILNLLKGKGFTEKEILLSGMIVKRDNRPGFYDRFRDRIMFPINDINGNTLAFSARINPEKEAEEKMGKYINSPQTSIYDKSSLLFGLDKAKLEIKKNDYSVIVEGQMDVISTHQAGFKNVVATSGTALTVEQITLLKRYSNNIALAFDMDDAGAMAADRGIREAMKQEMSIKVIEIPNGKDPDECVKENPDDWKKALKESKSMMQYYLDKILDSVDISNIEQKRDAAKRLLTIISRIGDKIEQDYWIKELAYRLDVQDDILREALKGKIQVAPKYNQTPNLQNEPPKEVENKKATKEEILSELLLALVFRFPHLLSYIINNIQIDYLVGEDIKGLYKNIIVYYNNVINSDVSENAQISGFAYTEFKSWLENTENISISENKIANLGNQLNLFDKLVILGDEEYYELREDGVKAELIKLLVQLKRFYVNSRMREVEKLIAHAERERDADLSTKLLEEFRSLSDELRGLNNI